MKEWMFEALDYDLWANGVWAEALADCSIDLVVNPWIGRIGISEPWPDFPKADATDRAAAIFAHILWAQWIWISRCGVTVTGDGSHDARDWMRPLNEAWKRLLDREDVFERITYRNTMGIEGRLTLGEIARHVLNHSTYHRGQLRDAAEGVAGLEIPSTDLLLFFQR